MLAIPLAQPDISDAEVDAVVKVLRSGTLSIGPEVEVFERKMAAATCRRYGIAVSSGTAALHLCMLAAGVGPGDDVVTSPFSFVASTNCILMAGANPVFADIDEASYNLCPDAVAAAITPATKAVVAIDVFGNTAHMPAVEALCEERGLVMIEDACEALGTKMAGWPAGNFGTASVFGFYPNKQITTGEGGMIVTDDGAFADTCRALRNQGRGGMGWLAHDRLGYNYRLPEIAAAMGNVQLERLPELLGRRREVAGMYLERLAGRPELILPSVPDGVELSWFVFVARLAEAVCHRRDQLILDLRAAGVGSANYFPPIHLQPYMVERFGYRPGDFPVTERVSAGTFALPFHGRMTQRQVATVCDVLEGLLDGMRARAAA